jgi:homoserine kinase
MGGFVLIRSYAPLDLIKITTPVNLYCTVITPDIELRTEDARKVLKLDITMKDAILQWGNLAALIDAINKAKPPTTKGIFVKKLSVSSTMGAGVRIDSASLV